MTSDDAGRTGFSGRLMEGIEARIALAGFEFGEERDRLVAAFVAVLVAVVLVFVGLLTLNVLLVLVFWEQRVLVTGLLTAGYLLTGLALVLSARSRIVNAPQPFAATLEELRKDAETFRSVGGVE